MIFILILVIKLCFYGIYGQDDFSHYFDTNISFKVDKFVNGQLDKKLLNLTQQTTKVTILENYSQCNASGQVNLSKIIRDEQFEQEVCCDMLFSAHNEVNTFTIIGVKERNLTVVVHFHYQPEIKGGLLRMKYIGAIKEGVYKGAKVTKLKIMNAEEIDDQCTEGGVKFAKNIFNEIKFENNSTSLKCIGEISPGHTSYEPGLLYSRLLAQQGQK